VIALMRLARFCKSCGGRFIPETKFQRICVGCRLKIRGVAVVKIKETLQNGGK